MIIEFLFTFVAGKLEKGKNSSLLRLATEQKREYHHLWSIRGLKLTRYIRRTGLRLQMLQQTPYPDPGLSCHNVPTYHWFGLPDGASDLSWPAVDIHRVERLVRKKGGYQ